MIGLSRKAKFLSKTFKKEKGKRIKLLDRKKKGTVRKKKTVERVGLHLQWSQTARGADLGNRKCSRHL